MQLIPHRLRHKVGKASIYKLEGYSTIISIYIVYLLRYKVIIFPYKIVSLVINIGQSISYMIVIS